MLKDEFDLFHFSESVIDSTIHFDYKLKPGVPEKGNAIQILDINGYPEEMIGEGEEVGLARESDLIYSGFFKF